MISKLISHEKVFLETEETQFSKPPFAQNIVKHGLSFAQAAADKRVANLNEQEKNRLSTSEGQTGQNFKSKPESGKVPSFENELEKMLSDHGVNPDEFGKQWSSGKLSDAGEILRAMGEPSELSPEDIVQGEAIADQKVSELVGELPKSQAEDASLDSMFQQPDRPLRSSFMGPIDWRIPISITYFN